MNPNKLKMGLVAIFLFLITLPIFTEVNIESRVLQLENQMSQIGTKNAMQTYGANMAADRLKTQEQEWFVFGEALYWHARISGSSPC